MAATPSTRACSAAADHGGQHDRRRGGEQPVPPCEVSEHPPRRRWARCHRITGREAMHVLQQQLDRGVPFVAVVGERLADHGDHVPRQIRPQFVEPPGRVFGDAPQRRDARQAREVVRRHAGQALEQHGAERPDLAAGVDRRAGRLLGAHGGRRAK
jgi:hypothetical protein